MSGSINNFQVVQQLPEVQQSGDGRIFAYLLEEKSPARLPTPDRLGNQKLTPLNSNSLSDSSLDLKSPIGIQQNPSLDAYLSSLKAPTPTTGASTQPASPLSQAEQPLFSFLANPEELKWSRQAVYSEAVTAATSIQSQQYYHTKGRVLQLSDLVMETWYLKRSLRPLLEQLQSLLVPDPQKALLTPKVLSFVFGTQVFKPCVLTDLQWRETAWRGGEPCSVRLDMTLLEIPPSDLDPASRIRKPQSSAEAQDKGKLKAPLTDRQRQDAAKQAQAWLKKNQSRLPKEIKSQVQANRYRLSTDRETGTVSMFSTQGRNLGAVGTWDGRAFSTTNQSLGRSR